MLYTALITTVRGCGGRAYDKPKNAFHRGKVAAQHRLVYAGSINRILAPSETRI